VTAKNDPSARALFQDALLDDTAKLGNVIVFEAVEPQKFLRVSILSKKYPFGALARLSKGTPL
jgi:hypothetical protein